MTSSAIAGPGPEPEVLEVLRAAREYITPRKNWCPSGWGHGRKRCAMHALRRAACGGGVVGAYPTIGYLQLKRVVREELGELDVGKFNDTHSHAEVLALFDRAIEIEEAKQAEFSASDDATTREPVAACRL